MSSNATQCAKLIRAELKKEFPTIKFSVTSDTGCSKVSIRYTDGATCTAVDAVVGKYQEQEYNGFTDYHDYLDNVHNLEHRVNYVIVNRAMSESARFKLANNLVSGLFYDVTADIFMTNQTIISHKCEFNTIEVIKKEFYKTSFN